ncbi:MAG TPA: respiratory nitrate reductase subunit gamma [Acidimicrobiia bacterium]|jgi:nitrate reductase gamma subunit|nr:respiratory nitrate reductase subunit gamma [Acidimicrobiia bacterium]
MSVDELLFAVLPYVALVLAVVVTVLRWRRHAFTVSALSSQILESRKLFWGSVSFHWGISIVLVGHLLALLIPSAFTLWNGAPLRLYLLEITGFGLGLWAAFGVGVLIYRRLSNRRVAAVTTPMDLVVLAVIAVQIITGLWIAFGYRWGSFWGPGVFTPYVRSLFVLDPRVDLVAPLPFILKTHVVAFWAFLLVFPFTRLVHIITVPLGYLFRPWQKVIRTSREPGVYHPASDRPLERV